MGEFIVILFFLFMWAIALVFLFLTIIFRKRKIGRWIFGLLTIAFVSLPYLLFWSVDNRCNNQQPDTPEQFVGEYINENNGYFLKLNKDLTWTADSTLFKCKSGKWSYYFIDETRYVEFKGDRMSRQTYSYDPYLHILSLDRDKPDLELKRK